MGASRKQARLVVAGLSAIGLITLSLLSGCSPDTSGNVVLPNEVQENFKKAALSFNMNGKEIKLWKTTLGEFGRISSLDGQGMSVRTEPIWTFSDVYAAPVPEQGSEAGTGEAETGEIEYKTFSEALDVNVPAYTAICVTSTDPTEMQSFKVIAANQDGRTKKASECELFELDVSRGIQDDCPLSISYKDVTFGSTVADVRDKLGTPSEDGYAEDKGGSFFYQLGEGEVQFGFGDDGTVDDILCTAAWIPPETPAVAEADFAEEPQTETEE